MSLASSTPQQSSFAPVCRDVAVLELVPHTPHDAGTPESSLFTLRLHAPEWEGWLPGQFVMVRPKRSSNETLWARPFSISRADEKELVLVFQVVGRGTKALLNLSPGELVTVWGPLGNCFTTLPDTPTLLLAGGIGIAPFVGYIENHPSPENLRLHFGHRLPLECYPYEACTSQSGKPVAAWSHRDGSPDDLVRFLATLENDIRETALRGGLVLACGPMPFLKSVQRFALRHNARAQLSLETRMACGVGACLGCVVKSKPGHDAAPDAFSYVQTCTCGPIFRADKIDLGEE